MTAVAGGYKYWPYEGNYPISFKYARDGLLHDPGSINSTKERGIFLTPLNSAYGDFGVVNFENSVAYSTIQTSMAWAWNTSTPLSSDGGIHAVCSLSTE